MDALFSAQEQLEQKGNLRKALTDVQSLLALLESTRNAVATHPETSLLHLAKLKTPLKQSFDRIEDDLKEVNKGSNQYQKALKDKFKNAALPTAPGGNDVMAERPGLVNRAIAMHLLREGRFGVASTFVREVKAGNPSAGAGAESGKEMLSDGDELQQSWLWDFADPMADVIREDVEADEEEDGEVYERGHMQHKFSAMYSILDALRNQHNLAPAIEWARQHSGELEARGSNLEFELCRLRFVELYTTSYQDHEHTTFSGPVGALAYARAVFPTFPARHTRSLSSLLGSLAFSTDLSTSPYHASFEAAPLYAAVSELFTHDFCSLLGLSPASPLRLAVTAGGIALPTLSKASSIMTRTRGQWSSVHELPVETPLPPSLGRFHSIFVCPVSKEQATDANPPMMMPCGHVIARESLEMHARGKSRVKCPYCPCESQPREARRVYI